VRPPGHPDDGGPCPALPPGDRRPHRGADLAGAAAAALPPGRGHAGGGGRAARRAAHRAPGLGDPDLHGAGERPPDRARRAVRDPGGRHPPRVAAGRSGASSGAGLLSEAARPAAACYAVTAPGLEPLAVAELSGLGLLPGPAEPGGVPFAASILELARATLALRTACRVMGRMGGFHSRERG